MALDEITMQLPETEVPPLYGGALKGIHLQPLPDIAPREKMPSQKLFFSEMLEQILRGLPLLD